MRAFILIFALLAFQPAQAIPAKPVRTVKVMGKIMKLSISPTEISNETVCELSSEIPVFDHLQSGESATEGGQQSCETEIAGAKTKLLFSGLVFLSSKNEPGRTAKSAHLTLTIERPGKKPVYVSGAAGVGDGRAESWSLSLQSQIFRSSRGVEETLLAEVEFVELPGQFAH